MGTWMNDDGLYIRYGTTEVDVALGGENTTDGDVRHLEIDFDFSDLAAYGTAKIIGEGVRLPVGAWLKSATLLVTTAFAGATGTLTLGTIDTDRSTVHDADGIDAAIAVTAIDAIGDTIACDGALIGTVLANTTPLYITATVGTAQFTAGAAKLTIEYFIPQS
jgi:hypothetical protein